MTASNSARLAPRLRIPASPPAHPQPRACTRALAPRRALALAGALGALAVLVPAVARAQAPAAPPTEDQIEAAKVLYKEARELRRQGRQREATDKALEAFHTAATPVTALQVGELLVEGGRLVEARDIARGVALLPVSPRESDKGRDARAQAAALGAQLDSRIPKLAFANRPPAVQLSLDGRPLAPSDPTAWQGVDPGPHVLLLRVDEKPCTTINLALSEGEERTVDLHGAASACRVESAPLPPAPPSPPRPAVLAPAPAPAPPKGGEPAGGTPGEAHTQRWIGLSLGVAGLAAVGVGGFVALSAKSDYDGVASACPNNVCSQTAFDTRNAARSRADVAGVVMGVGAAAVVGGVVLWVLEPSPGRVGVSVGPGSLGVAGSFR